MKQMIRKQLGGVPEAQRAMLIAAIDKNPDLFIAIAKEVQEKTKAGMNEQQAAMEVFRAHESELRGLLGH